MSRLQGPIKENFDSRIKSALELMKRGELRETFSILSKELYAVAILEIDNPHDLDENSALYHYELLYRLINKFGMYDSFEFVMHFVAVDMYLLSLGHRDADLMYHDDLERFNTLLLSFIKIVTTGAYDRVVRFKASGYEFVDRLSLAASYDFIYEFYSVRFAVSEYDLVVNDEYEESVKEMLSCNNLSDLVNNYQNIITESTLDDIRTENCRSEIEEVVKKYRNQIQGSGKTNALKNVTGRVEDFIHNFVYQYFVQEFSSSYVFSELAVTNFRYDLFISRSNELSLVVELKAFRSGNGNIDEAIDQVIGYLRNGKTEILKRPLDFAVILVFNATGKEISSSNYTFDILNDLTIINEDDRVIICEVKM